MPPSLPPEARRPPRGAESGEAPAARKGRDLVPQDLWAEIEALATGKRPRVPPAPPQDGLPQAPPEAAPEALPVPARVPRPTRPRPRRARPLPTRSREPRALESHRPVPAPVPVPKAPLVVVEDPVEPVVARVEDAPESGRHERAAAPSLLAELDLSHPGAARKAMILQEVLGPPLAARERDDRRG